MKTNETTLWFLGEDGTAFSRPVSRSTDLNTWYLDDRGREQRLTTSDRWYTSELEALEIAAEGYRNTISNGEWAATRLSKVEARLAEIAVKVPDKF